MADNTAQSAITDEELKEWSDLVEHTSQWVCDGFSDQDQGVEYTSLEIFDGPVHLQGTRIVASDINRLKDAEALMLVTTAVPALIAEVRRLRGTP